MRALSWNSFSLTTTYKVHLKERLNLTHHFLSTFATKIKIFQKILVDVKMEKNSIKKFGHQDAMVGTSWSLKNVYGETITL